MMKKMMNELIEWIVDLRIIQKTFSNDDDGGYKNAINDFDGT